MTPPRAMQDGRPAAMQDWRNFRLVSSLAVILGFAMSCHRAPPPVQYQPYESVTQILADFAAHRGDDLYRFGYPRDLTGQNLFRATLARIENYQDSFPGAFTDVLAVARGQALERLCDYSGAILAYENLGQDPSDELAATAAQSASRVRQLASVARRPLDSSSVSRYLSDLERKRDDLLKMTAKLEGTTYQTLAWIEAEQADLECTLFLFHNRYVLPEGLDASLAAMSELIERNAHSARIYEHRVRFGDFYFAAIKDFAAVRHPARGNPDLAPFLALAAKARDLYFQVSQQDGAPEKIEARHKLRALESFVKQVQDQRR